MLAEKTNMEFLKKNWSKLLISALLLVGAIFALTIVIPAFNWASARDAADFPDPLVGAARSSGFGYLGMMIAFIALIAFIVLNMFKLENKKIAPIVLIVGALIATIFIIISLAVGSDALDAANAGLTQLREAYNNDVPNTVLYEVLGYPSVYHFREHIAYLDHLTSQSLGQSVIYLLVTPTTKR